MILGELIESMMGLPIEAIVIGLVLAVIVGLMLVVGDFRPKVSGRGAVSTGPVTVVPAFEPNGDPVLDLELVDDEHRDADGDAQIFVVVSGPRAGLRDTLAGIQRAAGVGKVTIDYSRVEVAGSRAIMSSQEFGERVQDYWKRYQG